MKSDVYQVDCITQFSLTAQNFILQPFIRVTSSMQKFSLALHPVRATSSVQKVCSAVHLCDLIHVKKKFLMPFSHSKYPCLPCSPSVSHPFKSHAFSRMHGHLKERFSMRGHIFVTLTSSFYSCMRLPMLLFEHARNEINSQ